MNHSMFMKIISLCFIFTLASGPVFAQDDNRTFEIWTQDFAGRITFNYSPEIAQDAIWEWLPASPDFRTPTGPLPECTQITFQNYSDELGWVASGQKIYVYPVVTFPDNPAYPFAQELANLRQVLSERPARPDRPLPMLPIVTATQLFRAQAQYLDFPGGAGVRYITAAGLDRSPLSNPVVFYTFQGLTNDGAYYVAAQFPLDISILPDEAPHLTTEEYEAFAASYDDYIAGLTQQLEGLAPQTFAPDLTVLDQLFTSLEITPPAATMVTPAQVESARVVFENITFEYDAQLASRIEVDVVPPFVDPGGMAMFGSQPGYTVFSLFGYPVMPANNYTAIRVMPVDRFPAADTISDQLLAQLQDFLAARPVLSAWTSASGATPIPVLPPINAAQVIVAKPEYLDFQNGFGVRFITYYSQGIDPITNDTIFYQFIGMTGDGSYVVSAKFPVTAPVLPEIDYATLDYDALASNYAHYLDETLAKLDGLDAAAYTPALDLLDDLIRTLKVGG